MNYSETLDYLFSRLPMFHRIGSAAYKADLNNIIALTDLLGHPEKKFRSVHIAGTNGKGSTSHMLASIMKEAGYKTGLFTSPHLKDFRERIRINGKMIDEEVVMRFVEDHDKLFAKVEPSFFEWTTALAFDFFAKEKVDVAIIETGLGGRLDSTNIISPELSVITNISYDHMQLLGDTLEKIAKEKAGIIKEDIPVIIGERQMECETVFINRASEMVSPILFASDNYKAEHISFSPKGQRFRINKNGQIVFDELLVELNGNYQAKNICTVLQSIESLKNSFSKIDETSIMNGLKNVKTNTGLRGRWDMIGENPLTIVDVAHNEAGIKYVMEQLRSIMKESSHFVTSADVSKQDAGNYIAPVKKLHIVFGIVNDKDPSKILSLLPKDAEYYFCKADIPRALDADELKKIASQFGLIGESHSSVAIALKVAKEKAKEDDVIFIGGSTFVVAEAI